jgi:hypothetical protein
MFVREKVVGEIAEFVNNEQNHSRYFTRARPILSKLFALCMSIRY